MTSEKFRTLLSRAVSGDMEAMEAILHLYMQLINKYTKNVERKRLTNEFFLLY